MTFNVQINPSQSSYIKVIGVGGGGGNAVNYMYGKGIQGVDFFIANTDIQALEVSPVPNKIQLGSSLTEGLGAGSDPQMGKRCAEESIEEIKKSLSFNSKMVFVTAGMGGGTGTGAAPVIAKVCKDMGLLTVGIVTTPFKNEGPKRLGQATQGIEELRPHVDALLIIDNDRILEMYNDLRYSEAFAKADDVLCTAAKGIAEIITITGSMNVDFRDVRTAMLNSGRAIMGRGVSDSKERAVEASKAALDSPLLNNTDIEGAQHILLNISFEHEEPYAKEVEQILEYFQNAAGQNAVLKFGLNKSEGLGNSLAITVIATGFEQQDVFVDPAINNSNQSVHSINENAENEENCIQFDLNDQTDQDSKPVTESETSSTSPFVVNRQFMKPETPPNTHTHISQDLFGGNYQNRGGIPHDFHNPKTDRTRSENTSTLEIPAYKRMNIELEEMPESKSVQKLFLDEEDGEIKTKESGNRFLNKNID